MSYRLEVTSTLTTKIITSFPFNSLMLTFILKKNQGIERNNMFFWVEAVFYWRENIMFNVSLLINKYLGLPKAIKIRIKTRKTLVLKTR